MTHPYINEALQRRVDRIVEQRADGELNQLIAAAARATGRNELSDGWSNRNDLLELRRQMRAALRPRIIERIQSEVTHEIAAAAIAATKSFCEKAGG